MSVSMNAIVYTDNDRTGASRLYGLAETPRYSRIPYSSLNSAGLALYFSSATVFSSYTADATLILFAPSMYPFGGLEPDYTGKFLQITNQRGSGSQVDVNRLSDHGFDNQTTSMLLVAPNRGNELRFSFRDLFLGQWRTLLDDKLAGTKASRNGDPIFTWEPWPAGISYLSPDQVYLKIHQSLVINPGWWWSNYSASLTYHVSLYLDAGGRLNGYAARYGYWISGGAKTASIEAELAPLVIDGLKQLSQELSSRLQAYSALTFRDLYYLPGNQTSRPSTGVITGSTLSDATIVLQL